MFDKPTQDMLDRVTRGFAWASKEDHGYLPRTPDEVDKFVPHEWVREAVRYAYQRGKDEGRREIQQTVRKALGL